MLHGHVVYCQQVPIPPTESHSTLPSHSPDMLKDVGLNFTSVAVVVVDRVQVIGKLLSLKHGGSFEIGGVTNVCLIEPNSLLCLVVCPEGRDNLPVEQVTILVPLEAVVLCREVLLCGLLRPKTNDSTDRV